MKFSNRLIEAVNNRNRDEMNICFKEIYDSYIRLLYYNAYRIVVNKELALEVANETFLSIFKNITSVDNIIEDLCYINDELAKKAISDIDNISSDYNELLNRLNVTDDEFNSYVNLAMYERKPKEFVRNIGGNVKVALNNMYKAMNKLDEKAVIKELDEAFSYDDISARIEMTDGKFFVREKKFQFIGVGSFILTLVLFVVAFVLAAIPSYKGKIPTVLFYVCGVFIVIGIISLMISSYINKSKYNGK